MRGFASAQSESHPNPRLLLAGAAVYAAAHAPFLARSLEDIDSINFALGLRDFDVAQHQPHPPGYPVYIGLGHVALGLVRLILPNVQPSTAEALALAGLSALAGAVAVVSLGVIFSALDRLSVAPARHLWWWATALTVAAPLFWISGVRPMSDLPGLSLALVSLALMLGADTRASLLAGALVAGLAAGVRVQTALLDRAGARLPDVDAPGIAARDTSGRCGAGRWVPAVGGAVAMALGRRDRVSRGARLPGR